MTPRRFQAYIDGIFPDCFEVFESFDPASGRSWALMPAAGSADIDRAITAAHRAPSDSAWSELQARSFDPF